MVIITGLDVVDAGLVVVLLIDKDEVPFVLSADIGGKGVRGGTITELHGGGGVYRMSEGAVALAVARYVYPPSTVI